jgi:hypothetical protein
VCTGLGARLPSKLNHRPCDRWYIAALYSPKHLTNLGYTWIRGTLLWCKHRSWNVKTPSLTALFFLYSHVIECYMFRLLLHTSLWSRSTHRQHVPYISQSVSWHTTLQTSVQNGSRSRYIIPVNHKNKLRASCTIKVRYKRDKNFHFHYKGKRAVRVFVHLAGIALSARIACMLIEVSGYWLRGISSLLDGEMYRLKLQYNGRDRNILL